MNNKELISIVQQKLNVHVFKINKVRGGLAHYVYKLLTEKGVVFVKIRGKYFSVLRNISMDPTLIKFEKQALKILFELDLNMFPKLLGYIPKKNLIIMSDVMPERRTLEMELDSELITNKDAENLGKTLAVIHLKLAKINKKIRRDGDVAFYNRLLFYRFGFQSHKILDELIITLKKSPRQLIMGDLSPKNIGVSLKRSYTFCDFENFHYGNTICDVGFLGASVIIHNMNNKNLGHKLLKSFLKGYGKVIDISVQEFNIKKIILGIILYRLDNPVIPYSISISNKQRRLIIKNVNNLLFVKNFSWEKLLNVSTVK